ncbi:I-spanin [Pseudomonas sp. IT-P74]|uniref:hypothetical protein n=1 Tax=Pseudomonas sp. IT-P74 TaxID=3026445 RepID=UPI0039E112DB
MNKYGLAGLVIGGVYCAYLAVGALSTIGGYGAVQDLNECMEISAKDPISKLRAKEFLIKIDSRVVAETTAANVVQGAVAIADAAAGQHSQDPSLAPALKECLAKLKQAIEN